MKFWIIVGVIILLIVWFNSWQKKSRKRNLIKRYGYDTGLQLLQGQISLGMNPAMVQEALGVPGMHEGKIIRQGYTYQVLYYGVTQDEQKKTLYKYRVVFENDQATEIQMM